ncbi:MAG TPA: hypothetical protein VFE17_08540 [Candidatus Baltobacteraceae bacterium]|nr:hypothetical protein [Candidatus Baltobacteraceae bacterium]
MATQPGRVFNAIVTVGISAIFFAIIVPPMFGGYTTAYTGLHAGLIGTGPLDAHVTIDPGSPAARAGLHDGDVIRCLHIRDYEMLFPTFAAPGYGTSPVRGCLIRAGRQQTFELVAQPGPPAASLYGAFGFVLLRVLAYAIFLFVGSALVILRPSLMTWLLFVFCVCTSPAAAASEALTSLSPGGYFVAVGWLQLEQFVSSAALLLFTLVFPDASLPRGWRGYAFWAVFAVSVTLYSLKLVQMFHATVYAFLSDPLTINFNLIAAAAVVAVALGRLATMRPADRARFGWVTFGIVVGVVANYLRLLPGVSSYGTFAGTVTAVMPITLMYGILRRHVIDVRFAISRTVVYGVITTMIVCVIAGVDFLTGEYLKGLRIALAIDALVTISLGVALHRMYGTIENAVDLLIYRRKHEAETYLKRLAHTLLRADREDTIDRAVVEDPYERLDLTMAALLRLNGEVYSTVSAQGWNGATHWFEREHDVVRFLATERRRLDLRDLRERVRVEIAEPGVMPAMAVPIFEGDDLRGFALYGLHRDGTKLDPDEVDVLETLCQTAAQAYVRIENLRMRELLRFADVRS